MEVHSFSAVGTTLLSPSQLLAPAILLTVHHHIHHICLATVHDRIKALCLLDLSFFLIFAVELLSFLLSCYLLCYLSAFIFSPISINTTIMPTHKEFTAWIVVDGKKLPEYKVTAEEDGRKVACYIPSMPGQVRCIYCESLQHTLIF